MDLYLGIKFGFFGFLCHVQYFLVSRSCSFYVIDSPLFPCQIYYDLCIFHGYWYGTTPGIPTSFVDVSDVVIQKSCLSWKSEEVNII